MKRVFPARGCRDILIAVTDGLKGMSEALAAVFPETTLQTCIVHLIRQSLDFATWKERKPLATALRTIYGAPSAEAAGAALTHEIPDTPEAKRFYANKPQVSEAVGRATARHGSRDARFTSATTFQRHL